MLTLYYLEHTKIGLFNSSDMFVIMHWFTHG